MSKLVGTLRDRNIYEAFVQNNDAIGLITVRDLLNVRDIESTKIASAMHRVPKLRADSRVQEAAQIMFDYRIRSVPIVDNKNNVTGQVTSFSIIEKMVGHNSAQNIRAENIMTPGPITLERSDEAAKARTIMLRRRIDHLPLLDQAKLMGIVTSSNLLFNLWPPESAQKGAIGAEKQNRFEYPVENVADTDVVTSGVADTLPKVFSNIKSLSATYSLVTLWDELQGIITYRDFMKLLEDERRTKLDIPLYIVGLPEDPFEAEATRAKFTREVTQLRKSFPEIEEARSIIKTSKQTGARNRYEVQVMIKTPTKVHSYRDSGYELPDIYDSITNWMKKLLAASDSRPKRRRTRVDPGVPVEPELA
jgi:CBS domain-containing protein